MEAPSSSDGSKARRNRTPVPKPLWADMVDPSREKKQVEKEKEKNAKEEPMEEEWWEKDWKDSRKTWNDGEGLTGGKRKRMSGVTGKHGRRRRRKQLLPKQEKIRSSLQKPRRKSQRRREMS